jgi:predicted nucleotidyltransferase
MKQITHEYLVENNLILFEVIVGSQAHGTSLPTSDEDRKFVYILPEEFILGNKYVEQIDINADYTGWEIRRFLELLESNNPTVFEILYSPEDCIISKHPLFDILINNRDKFITKICKNSFGGYARQQITKAKGLNKKQNWEKEKITRKDVLDFCYVIEGNKTIPWRLWNEANHYDEKFIGVVNTPNARDIYAVYFDVDANNCFSEKIPEELREAAKKWRKESGISMGFGYKGLVKSGEGNNITESNQLRLSSIPKGEKPIAVISYNKDGYTQHCKDYREYQEWLEKRNETRYVETKTHGQQIDGKNMLHCVRLINMATEIAEGKGVQVRRPDREYLLSIRRGEVPLEELIDLANEKINKLDELFNKSNLPDKVEDGLVHKLLVDIRKNFYNR